jgi:hypothetical protein
MPMPVMGVTTQHMDVTPEEVIWVEEMFCTSCERPLEVAEVAPAGFPFTCFPLPCTRALLRNDLYHQECNGRVLIVQCKEQPEVRL